MSKMSAKKLFTTLAVAVAALLLVTGCDGINDDAGDCTVTYKLKFRYDMNLKYADAFAHEVKAVHLYALDANDNVVWEKEERGDALAEADYAMTLDLQPGTYKLLAWCTTNDNNTYYHTFDGRTRADADDAVNGNHSDFERLGIAVNGSKVYTSNKMDIDYTNKEMDLLYHGLLSTVTLPDEAGTHVYTMPLTRDTKRVRIILQHASGKSIDAGDFMFRVEAYNGLLRADNTPKDNYLLRCEPWSTTTLTSAVTLGNGTETDCSAALAEITTTRLMADDAFACIYVYSAKDYQVILRVPFLQYALAVKGSETERAAMSDQEYLDRQDEYNLTFFLDDNDRWIDSYIYINSWKVVLQNTGV